MGWFWVPISRLETRRSRNNTTFPNFTKKQHHFNSNSHKQKQITTIITHNNKLYPHSPKQQHQGSPRKRTHGTAHHRRQVHPGPTSTRPPLLPHHSPPKEPTSQASWPRNKPDSHHRKP
ncbi:hypothetical protein MIMGU_mgv1a016523mg [Erythranthe guttata]|uniref:Uncharacterized protein n=1 Tax=Erythranthe guttata TaxID=4155 RepID=A0A022RD63_ERYGU|nr:hypothetical protein MIMGU_mgv1a016523mg [Erythranthe guttata]